MFLNTILFISFFIDVIKTSSMLCFKKTVRISPTLSFLNIKNPCIKCKWFIPNPNTNPSEKNHGFCRKFKKFNNNKMNSIQMNNMYEYAIDCRKNDFQCGKNAYYFEPKEEENEDEEQYLNNEFDDDEDSKNIEELLTLQNQIKEMEELNCGEVNEKRDLDDWETEYISVKKRIEKLLNSRIKE